jgi:hypothetical protein
MFFFQMIIKSLVRFELLHATDQRTNTFAFISIKKKILNKNKIIKKKKYFFYNLFLHFGIEFLYFKNLNYVSNFIFLALVFFKKKE